MDTIIEQLIGPTNPNDFVGRNLIIDQYHDLLRDFVRGNDTVHWIHISGSAGIGKSSLLRKFRMMTEQERIATGMVDVPISPHKGKEFLTDIKHLIDEMAPEWRSFLQRKMKYSMDKVIPVESTGYEVSSDKLNSMYLDFIKDLDVIDKKMKESKYRNAIFLDDLDRIVNFEYFSLLQIFPLIAKYLKDHNSNILFVTSGNLLLNEHLNLKESNVLHLKLNQFDFTEAELMVRRRGKLVKSDREQVVQASTRFPFDLALRQLILSKEFDPNILNDEVIAQTLGFTDQEVDLLRYLSISEKNYFIYDELIEHFDKAIIEELRNNILLNISQDGYVIFESMALWELVSHVFKPIDPRTEIIILLNRIREQAEIGQMPSVRDVKIVSKNFRSIKETSLLFELSGQLAEATKAALEGSLFKTAWDLLELATIGLERTMDYEKIADLQESIAKGFAKANQEYFAAQSFQKAGEFFRKAGIEWRSVSNFREAGLRYFRQAEHTEVPIFHYAIRSMLTKSIRAYENANELNQAKKVKASALEILKGYEHHNKYFEELIMSG